MLNRSDVFKQLQKFVIEAAPKQSVTGKILEVWHMFVSRNDELRDLVASKQWPFPVPLWFGYVGNIIDVQPFNNSYGIVGMDGSQIYPDRFYSNVDCFVINTGGISVAYQQPESEVVFFSRPYVYSLREVSKRYGNEIPISKDLVDLIREEFEFKDALLEAGSFRKAHPDLPFLCLLDGSFIFWHLEGKPLDIRELFLSSYMLYLRRFQEEKILVAGYISLPRNRELCNVLRIILCEQFLRQRSFCFIDPTCPCSILQEVTDIDLVAQLLRPGQRTEIFMSRSTIADQYFDELRPCFFFINVGNEIGRVELPWWMAKDKSYVDFVAQIIVDQSVKGLGYPLVLAEAHEQAVVKHHDKIFFYEILDQLSREKSSGSQLAVKNLRKRRMPV